MSEHDGQLLLYAVGDVGPNRKDPDSMFQFVKNAVRGEEVDIVI